jgi:hypothetical protein
MATFVSDEKNKSEKIDDLINRNAPNKFISVEFFPPKTAAGKYWGFKLSIFFVE